eukprot:COSAG03_NODE_25737_length_264_cov_0.466667_1_plen_44_part_10
MDLSRPSSTMTSLAEATGITQTHTHAHTHTHTQTHTDTQTDRQT